MAKTRVKKVSRYRHQRLTVPLQCWVREEDSIGQVKSGQLSNIFDQKVGFQFKIHLDLLFIRPNVPIRPFLPQTLRPFDLTSIRHFVHQEFCKLDILSIRPNVHLKFCPLDLLPFRSFILRSNVFRPFVLAPQWVQRRYIVIVFVFVTWTEKIQSANFHSSLERVVHVTARHVNSSNGLNMKAGWEPWSSGYGWIPVF